MIFPSATDSSSTIQTLLDDFDAVEKLTALLDLEERAWMHFGSKLGMERLELNSLREESPPSPTKLLMKHIVAKKPDLTMKFFLRALASIKRLDVIKELKKFFVGKNILVNFRINHYSCLKWQFTSNFWLIRQNPNSTLTTGAHNQQFLKKTLSIYNKTQNCLNESFQMDIYYLHKFRALPLGHLRQSHDYVLQQKLLWSLFHWNQNKGRGHSDWIRSAVVVIVKDCFFKKTYI